MAAVPASTTSATAAAVGAAAATAALRGPSGRGAPAVRGILAVGTGR
ncbi:hypothetical protein [Streptomyces sp. NPDC048332]